MIEFTWKRKGVEKCDSGSLRKIAECNEMKIKHLSFTCIIENIFSHHARWREPRIEIHWMKLINWKFMFDAHVRGGMVRLHGDPVRRTSGPSRDRLFADSRNCRRLFLILKMHAGQAPHTAFINRSATPYTALALAVWANFFVLLFLVNLLVP